MALQLERPLAVFDLETTGIRVGQDRIVQIAIVRMMPDGTRDRWQNLVDPGMPIPPEATAIHGISDMDVAGAPTIAELAPQIIDRLDDCDLAGFNCIRFDLPMLAEELFRCGIAWDSSRLRVVDVQRIFHKKEPRDLSAAVRFYLGRPHEEAHDALGDVEATADVLLAQLSRYEDLPHTVPDLATMSGDRERSPDPAGKLSLDAQGGLCLNFGKYRGWSLETIGRTDPGYLQWLFTKAEMPASTLALMRQALAHLES